MHEPFLPVARPMAGRQTQTDLFCKAEVPFPLLTRQQKLTIRTIRAARRTCVLAAAAFGVLIEDQR